jgi:hypothetical protein
MPLVTLLNQPGIDLEEEHRYRVFQNRILKVIFGPRSEKVTVGWRKLHNEVLHKFYSSADTIRAITSGMRWAENAAYMGEMRNGYIIMVGKN